MNEWIRIDNIPVWKFTEADNHNSVKLAEFDQLMKSHMDSSHFYVPFSNILFNDSKTEESITKMIRICINQIKQKFSPNYIPLFIHVYPDENNISFYI